LRFGSTVAISAPSATPNHPLMAQRGKRSNAHDVRHTHNAREGRKRGKGLKVLVYVLCFYLFLVHQLLHARQVYILLCLSLSLLHTQTPDINPTATAFQSASQLVVGTRRPRPMTSSPASLRSDGKWPWTRAPFTLPPARKVFPPHAWSVPRPLTWGGEASSS